MGTSERTRDRGRRSARLSLQRLGTELRDARLAAGLSQRHIAGVAGLSQSAVSRTELAQSLAVTVEDLAQHCAALGLRLNIKVYPEGSAVRDAGQLRLVERFRAQVGEPWRWATEVLVGNPGDLRAWDVRLAGPGTVGIDAETRLHDMQALQRRCEAKARDSGVDRVVLLVAETRHNAAVLRDHGDALRVTFPADTATTLAALRAGMLPEQNGIVVL